LISGIRLGGAPDPPDTVGALVVAVGLLRAVVERDQRDAVERVVRIGGQLALGVGLGEEVAGVVVGIDGIAGIRARLLREVPQAVYRVAGDEATRIGHLGERIPA